MEISYVFGGANSHTFNLADEGLAQLLYVAWKEVAQCGGV